MVDTKGIDSSKIKIFGEYPYDGLEYPVDDAVLRPVDNAGPMPFDGPGNSPISNAMLNFIFSALSVV